MPNVNNIAIQMYTVREMAAEDFEGTLAKIAGIGYKAIELAGLHGHSAQDVRAWTDKYGLKVAGAHISVMEFEDDVDEVAEDLVELGADWGIIPWIAPDKRNESSLRAYGEQFNTYADKLSRRNIKFAYHNHDFEFLEKAENGQDLFDMLMTVTDVSRVYFELDAYWASVAGRDPADVLRHYRERIRLVHLKDGFDTNLVHGGDVPFGEGNLDFTELFKAAAASKVDYYITEQDTRKDVETEIAQSFRNAAAVLG